MIQIIKNSFLYKCIEKLCIYYKNGSIHSFFMSIKNSYSHSKFKLFWTSFISKTPLIYSSKYAKIIANFELLLAKFGVFYENSVFCKLFNSFCQFIETSIKKSKLLSRFSSLGFKRFLLFIITLYLPIDYILRSIIVIPILSSLWDEMLLFLGFLTILYRLMTKKNILTTRITPLDPFIFLYFASGLVLLSIVSPSLSIAIDGYRAVFQYILFFFIISSLVENAKDFKLIFNTLIVMIACIGCHGIVQFILATPIPETWMTQSEEAVRTRVFSILGSPNVMGSILVLLTPMLASYVYTSKKLFYQIIALGFTGIMCLSVLFTFSKGAWFGMFVAVILFAIFIDLRLIGLMISAGACIVVAVPSVVNRITYLFTEDYALASSAGGRTMRWEFGLNLLDTVNSWFGFGLGRFGGAVAMQNQVLETSDSFSYFYLDNYYLKTLVEMGYLGLGFYILLLASFVFFSVKSIGRLRGTSFYIPCSAMFSGMCGVLIHCYFENIFEVPYMTAYFWIMAGLIMSAGYLFPKSELDNF